MRFFSPQESAGGATASGGWGETKVPDIGDDEGKGDGGELEMFGRVKPRGGDGERSWSAGVWNLHPRRSE